MKTRLALVAVTVTAAAAAIVSSAGALPAAGSGGGRAAEYDHWQSPTGRIRCDYRSGVGVGCVQLDSSWGMWLQSFGGSSFAYPYSWPGVGRTLYYGQTWARSSFRCLSQSAGMKCWSTYTGHGFFISRETRRRW